MVSADEDESKSLCLLATRLGSAIRPPVEQMSRRAWSTPKKFASQAACMLQPKGSVKAEYIS